MKSRLSNFSHVYHLPCVIGISNTCSRIQILIGFLTYTPPFSYYVQLYITMILFISVTCHLVIFVVYKHSHTDTYIQYNNLLLV